MKKISTVLFSLITTMTLAAQEKMSSDTNAVKSIDGIVKEVLRLVSGAKGQTRNWEALRNLFLPTATFTVLNNNDSIQQPVEAISLDDFIKLMHDEYYEQGYLEYETARLLMNTMELQMFYKAFMQKIPKINRNGGIIVIN
jgi:hypothetical protein